LPPAPGAVLHNDRLIDLVRQLGAHHAHERVEGAAGDERDDDADQNQRTSEPLLRTYAHFGTTRRPDDLRARRGSPIAPAETAQRLKQTLPNCEIVTMPGLGHYPSEEDRVGFLTIVNRFLQRG
jgi:pimeloyl-ACP methyl ester carboxylesterase